MVLSLCHRRHILSDFQMIQTNFAIYIVATLTLLCIPALVFRTASAQDEDAATYLVKYCSEYSHYDAGTEFQSNLALLTTTLTSKSPTNKFYSFTAGATNNKVYGLFLCNSFISNQACNKCVATAVGQIPQRCSFSKEYIVWYVQCMLRYSNNPIFSVNDESVYYTFMYPPADYDQFNQTLSQTFVSLSNNVAGGSSSLPSNQTVVEIARNISLNCYVDCTPDLSPSNCSSCLSNGLYMLPMLGAREGTLLKPNCRLMYLFNDTRPPKSDQSRPYVSARCKEKTVALGVISAVAAASMFLNICGFRRQKPSVKPTGLDEIESMENLQFEFNVIKAATNNFSPMNELGSGGFGVVYKGSLPDGQAVAVKRLSNASRQGIREFKTEACLAAKLQHKNLAKVYGFCLEKDEMLLVYEFVPNKSLDQFLFHIRRAEYLDWETRYKIIMGIARGLLYLHEDSHPKIIHRDLKPSNILLDAVMNPKIADFGMAKLFAEDQSQGNTNRVAGTFGYMAPEYVTTGHFSNKSDIFSYGVIVLEIVSGTRNRCSDPYAPDENLLNYAWRLWNEGANLELVDSALESKFSKDEVERCIQVGLMCIQEDPIKRPNIDSVLLMLQTQPITFLPPVSPPAFPFKKEGPVVPRPSYGSQGGDPITDLSPR